MSSAERRALAERSPPATVDPAQRFPGTVVVLAPHMDDEVLACGGTIALLPRPERVHVIYATDGSRSPAPEIPGRHPRPAGLDELRRRESRSALAELGVPAANLHFLDLPDGGLRRRGESLERALAATLEAIRPQHVFAPFRYDRHPDHLAVNLAIHRLRGDRRCCGDAELLEYFVYHRSRLLRRGDVRAYVDPSLLLQVEIGGVAVRKRAALERFDTQTTRYFPWQTRPILTPALLDDVCASPEVFLLDDDGRPGDQIFPGPTLWLRASHRLEPVLKRAKDRAVAVARHTLGRTRG